MRKLSTDLIKSGSFTGSFSGSFYGLSPSSSYALTASFSNNSISASYSLNSTTATNLSGGTVNAISITGSLLGSSSFANNAISSSFSSVSISSSFARTASNLSPITQDLIPITGSTYSLGSPTNKWKDLYVSTGSIYIGETVLSTSGSTLFANSSPIVTLNTASGQIEVAGITASLSASFATNANLLNNTASTVFATTGSNNFSGSQTVQGNITVIGSLIAQQYVVSSSVSYFTSSNFDGSTKFGDTDSDTHQFTGSLRSPNITGSLLGTASIALIALVALTSSYINVATNAVSSSFASTASVSVSSSYSSYAITSSYVLNSVSSSYSLNSVSSSYSNVANTSTSATSATSANTATSSSFATTAGTATSATSANSATSASYALTASFALNSSGGGGGSGTVSGSVNYISKFTSGSAIGNSVIYETGSNIGIGTINPNAKLNINSSGSLVSGSVVFSVEGTQGSLFSVDDSLSGSLMSVNDISGLPILEVFSDDRLVVGTYNSNALVVTGSRVGIGTNNPIAKLQVSGNISGSSFTSSVSNGVGFLGTSSFAVTASFSLTASNVVTASYALNALTASFALNASGGGGGSGTVTGSLNYISKFTSTTTVGNSVMYETGSNIGIGTINPNAKLNINSSGSLVSGSVVFSVEGTQGSLFSVDDSLSGSLMSVNDISGLPILEVFSDDRLVVGTYNSNALVVTGSRVGIGTNNPIAKLQVNGNISASSFTGSVFGTSSWSTNALTASYAAGGGTTLTTGSTYPITSSWATTSSNIIGGTSNYIPLWSTNTSLGNSVLYQNSSNIGIGTTSPSYKLDVNGIIAVSNSPFADKTGNYNRIYNPSGDGCIYLGNVSDPGNYYDNTNHYFRNRGNTTTYVTINISGSVGIGTTSPASILHLQSSAATTLLRIDNSTNTNDAAILLTDSTNPTGEGLRITYDSSIGDTYFNNIYTVSTRAFNFQKGDFGSGTSLLTILNDGNVGIGTTSPNAKLHLSSTGGISAPILRISGTATDTYNWASAALYSNLTSSATAVHVIGKSETNYNSAYFGYKHSSDGSVNNAISFGFYAANDLVNILVNGNFGIGTTNPSAKLHVNGNISGSSFTGSVFGTSSWATNASTASYVVNSVSSSYSLTASYALNAASSGGSSSTSSLIGQTFVPTASVSLLSLTQSVSNNDQILVILDGLVQSRTGSYTVSGSTLTLTENAESGSIIDIRFLAGSSVSSSYAVTASYALTNNTECVHLASTVSYTLPNANIVIVPFNTALILQNITINATASTVNGIEAYHWRHLNTGIFRLVYQVRATTDTWNMISVCKNNNTALPVGNGYRSGIPTGGAWGISFECLYRVTNTSDRFGLFHWGDSNAGTQLAHAGTNPPNTFFVTPDVGMAPTTGYYNSITITKV